MILPNRAQLLGLAFLTTVATSAAAQSLLNQYGEVVLGSGQTPPSSGGFATDFPVGASMGITSAFWTAPITDLHGTEIFRAISSTRRTVASVRSNDEASGSCTTTLR